MTFEVPEDCSIDTEYLIEHVHELLVNDGLEPEDVLVYVDEEDDSVTAKFKEGIGSME